MLGQRVGPKLGSAQCFQSQGTPVHRVNGGQRAQRVVGHPGPLQVGQRMHPAVRISGERGLVTRNAALTALENEEGAAENRGIGFMEQHLGHWYLGVAGQCVHNQCLPSEVVFVDDAESTGFGSYDEALAVIKVDEEGIGGAAVADGGDHFRDGRPAEALGDPRRRPGSNSFRGDPSDDGHSQTSFRRMP